MITSVYRFSWSVVVSDLTPQICVEPDKLGVNSRTEAMVVALRSGLLPKET